MSRAGTTKTNSRSTASSTATATTGCATRAYCDRTSHRPDRTRGRSAHCRAHGRGTCRGCRVCVRPMTPAAARLLPLPRLFPIKQKINEVSYRVHCPAHEDRNPSCALRRKKGIWRWRCFACHASGDICDLVKLKQNCALPQALAWLVEHFGEIELPPPEPKPPFLLACWAPGCGATREIEPRTYRTPGYRGYEWTSSAALEALTAPGWHVAPDLIAALCPRHT